MEKEKYTTKSGKLSERYVLADVSKALNELPEGRYLTYVDRKTGKVCAVEMKCGKKLSEEEKQKREIEKQKKREATRKRVLANIAKKRAELEAREAKYL